MNTRSLIKAHSLALLQLISLQLSVPLSQRCWQPRGMGVAQEGRAWQQDVPHPSWAQPGAGQDPAACQELPRGRGDPVGDLCPLSCGTAGTGQGDAHAHPCQQLCPRVHRDLHGFTVSSGGAGTGMVSLCLLSVGSGFLRSLCCFPVIPKACGMHPGCGWIVPRLWQGGAAWGQLDAAPVSQSELFCCSGRCCMR